MRKWEPKFGANLLKIELINLIVFLKIGPSQQPPWKKDENGDQFRPHFSFFSVMAHLRLKDSSALNIFSSVQNLEHLVSCFSAVFWLF